MKLFRRRTFYILFSFVLSLATVYVFRGVFAAPIIKRIIVSQVQDVSGGKVSLGKIQGDYFFTLILNDITFTLPGQPPQVESPDFFTIKKIQLSYSLRDLFVSGAYFLGKLRVDILTLDGTFDLSTIKGYFSGESLESTNETEPASFVLPQLNIRDSALKLIDAETHVVLEGIDFNLNFDNKSSQSFLVNGMFSSRKIVIEGSASSPIHTSFSSGFELSDDHFVLSDVRVDGVLLSTRGDFFFGNLDDVFSINGTMDILGGQLELVVKENKGILDSQIQLAGISLDGIALLKFAADFPIQGILSGMAALHGPNDSFELFDATLTFEVKNAAYNDLPLGDMRIQATKDNEKITVENLESILGENTFQLQDVILPLAPIRHADLNAILKKTEGKFSFSFRDIPAFFQSFQIKLDSKFEQNAGPHDLQLRGSLHEGVLSVSQGVLNTQSGAIVIQDGTLFFSNPGESILSAKIKVDFSASIPELHELTVLFPVPEIYGSLEGRGVLTGPLSELEGSFDFHGGNLRFNSVPLGEFDIKAFMRPPELVIQRAAFTNNQDRIDFSGSYDYRGSVLKGMVFSAEIADAGLYATAFSENIEMHGAFSGQGNVSGPLLEPDIALDLNLTNFKSGSLSFPTLQFSVHNAGKHFEITKLVAELGDFNITALGSGLHDFKEKEFNFSLNEFTLSRSDTQWQLQKPARFHYISEKGLVVDEIAWGSVQDFLTIKGGISANKDLDIIGRGHSRGGNGWVDLISENLTFETAEMEFSARGNLEHPLFSAKGKASHLGSVEVPYAFSGVFDIQYSSTGLDVRKFEWETEDSSHLSISGTIPLAIDEPTFLSDGSFDIKLSMNIPDIIILEPFLPAAFASHGVARAEIEIAGPLDNQTGSIEISTRGIDAPVLQELFIPTPLDMNLSCRLRPGVLIYDVLLFSSGEFEINSTGKLFEIPSLQALLEKERDRTSGRISAKVKVKASDIGWLAERIDKLKKVSGAVLADFSVTGAIDRPNITGDFILDEGLIRPDVEMPSLRHIYLKSSLVNRIFKLEEFHGEMGGSPFKVSGSVDIREETPRFDIRLSGENLLFYRDDGVKVRADADLFITGPTDKLKISGKISLTDASFTKKFDFITALRGSFRSQNIEKLMLPSFREKPLRDAELNVRIVATNPFRVKNNIARAQVLPEITLLGTGEIPYLAGKLYIENGRLDLPAGRLFVDSGVVHFPENDPENPVLDFQGKSRIGGYDISVLIQGVIDEPVLTLTSSPPLPEEDLLYLVLTGKIPTTAGGSLAGDRGRNMKVAIYLAKGVMAQLFGQDTKMSEADLLERFEIEVGKGITRKGDETIEVEFLLLDEVVTEDGTLYITSEKDVFDEYNMGLKLILRFQ